MRRKYLTIYFILFLFGNNCYSQQVEKEQYEHKNLVAYLYELRQISGEDNITHTDTILNYKLNIPIWWKIRETPSITLFGGTFPEIDGIENALLFKSFSKENFDNITDFENWLIREYKIGDVPNWSDGSHKLLLKRELNEFENIGNSYFVQLNRAGQIYYCCYIAVETSNTFLWIDFTATEETYDKNFIKLKEIIENFKII